jgi:hypothetical protein
MLTSRQQSLLLAALGIGLLVNPSAPGLHFGEGSVYRYEAAAVDYNQSAGLQVTDPETGQSITLDNVDDEIICEGFALRRACQFEYSVYDGANVSALPSRIGYSEYEFVYRNETFYRPTTVERAGDWYMRLDPVTDPDPLRYVADGGDLSPGAQSAIASGAVLTYRELPEANTLVREGGEYYTVYSTGVKRYWSGGSFCSSGGDGFCGTADSKRWTDSLLTLGSWVLGAALVGVALRSRDE